MLDIEKNVPPSEVSLLGNPARVLVRSDLHPEIVYLLLKAMQAEHSEPGIFQRADEFPKSSDLEYPRAESAIEFYKNGPSFMQRHVPLWLSVHIPIDRSTGNSCCGRYPIVPLFAAAVPLERAPTIALLVRSTSGIGSINRLQFRW